MNRELDHIVRIANNLPSPARTMLAIALTGFAAWQWSVFGEACGKALFHLTH